jgi:hypothetical protein
VDVVEVEGSEPELDVEKSELEGVVAIFVEYLRTRD